MLEGYIFPNIHILVVGNSIGGVVGINIGGVDFSCVDSNSVH